MENNQVLFDIFYELKDKLNLHLLSAELKIRQQIERERLKAEKSQEA